MLRHISDILSECLESHGLQPGGLLMDCEFCDWDETTGDCCNDSSERGLLCTRRRGHRGDHVACDNEDHSIDVWRNSAEPNPLTDTDRLDFLLRFFAARDIVDDAFGLALCPDERALMDVLLVDVITGKSPVADVWTCDKRAVIDAAIRRQRCPQPNT